MDDDPITKLAKAIFVLAAAMDEACPDLMAVDIELDGVLASRLNHIGGLLLETEDQPE